VHVVVESSLSPNFCPKFKSNSFKEVAAAVHVFTGTMAHVLSRDSYMCARVRASMFDMCFLHICLSVYSMSVCINRTVMPICFCLMFPTCSHIASLSQGQPLDFKHKQFTLKLQATEHNEHKLPVISVHKMKGNIGMRQSLQPGSCYGKGKGVKVHTHNSLQLLCGK